MQPLEKNLRNLLERTVKRAREMAETAAKAALEQLGVGEATAFSHLTDDEKNLRRRLRTHGRSVGDTRQGSGASQTIQHLAQEVAYEHWHRMLFARFLAENDLLMYDGVAITIEECDELAEDADTRMGAKTGWELAAKLAARMLPQVFKLKSPVFELVFAPEHQRELEHLLASLAVETFKASDSLGWVYQFWQADNKERINKSEVKIGADELPAVTQLFTEPYMVAFLLHNSLGAWWVTRHPDTPCPVELTYLRTLEDGSPAAGRFEGWPDTLVDFKLLDPCCGSGHFLVAAFLMLVPMRMTAEGLNAKEAIAKVLADNLHGLELDPRCVEIAVFAVALEAWRYPDASGKPLGVREIPAPNIACCGLKVAAKAQDWEALVPDDATNVAHLRQGLSRLHETFAQAPFLGSLLDPSKANKGDLFSADYRMLTDLLAKALATERPPTLLDEEDEHWELALSAQGLLEAAHLLDGRYHLVVTNVPYLARGKQAEVLRDYCDYHYPEAKSDLANVFLERCHELTIRDSGGVIQVVMPQHWLYLPTYKHQRESLIKNISWNLVARLGSGAFETISGEVVNVALFTLTAKIPSVPFTMKFIDASTCRDVEQKVRALGSGGFTSFSQAEQLLNPDFIIGIDVVDAKQLLSNFATFSNGLQTGDYQRFGKYFWELKNINKNWAYFQSTVSNTEEFLGYEGIVLWEHGQGELAASTGSVIRGTAAWRKSGVAVSAMGALPVSNYSGELYDDNVVVLTPKDDKYLAPIWCYCSSSEYHDDVRLIDKALKVRSALLKVRFDLALWQRVASERYPNGFPRPYSNNPTQWIFHGHPQPATDPLQVAVARLLGYSWPAEADEKMELAVEARNWIARSQALASHADNDGIVCIPPVGREPSASDRLLDLLAAAYGDAWNKDSLAQLLSAADHAGKSLETWLREKFFAQHCKRFGNRPFIWHVWDGLSDGFAALVNYHKLDYKTLETLTYNYLGQDWIGRQKQDMANGIDGAEEKLAAAEQLKKKLELILEGEAPYDIFVRWKSIEEQPIGWNPDLNDGVRLNIRPFLSVPDVGKRGAGVLRDKPNIKWEKDRGSDVPSAPWYELGLQYDGKVGDRINDHHLTLEEKRRQRKSS